ncbi:MAG TPA: transposase [Ktedonobacteraceae bacterium]|nr:transposase [Ktedonobacteraceae bacterium]
MRRVEQHVIEKSHPQFCAIDEMALASKNLWNLANYHVRQSFIFQQKYLTPPALFHLLKATDAYQALPAKVANQVLLQLHKAWTAFFAAMEGYREHPEKFQGRPGLPKYLHKTQGRNLLIFELGCIWKAELRVREIAVSQLGRIGETRQQPTSVHQVRVVPKADHYVVEVLSKTEEKPARHLDPDLFVALDPGVNVLAALTSNKPGFVPRLVSGKPVKAVNQLYNKQREHEQKQLAKGKEPRFTSHRLDRITTKRNRRVMHYLHTASRRIVELLVTEGIGTLVLGKNPFWKTRVELGKKHNQEFVQIPHAKFLEMLTYKAEALGIRVIVTEESYTSKASFLDLDPLPTYDPTQGADQEEKPQFSGSRDGRWYRVKGRAPIHSDVNGSFNIGRKVFPTAFGPGIEATAVRPRRLAV